MKKLYLLILLLPLFAYSAFAQNRTIEGIITSADKNEPLVGVSVKIKGSTIGTQTDVNGKFTLKATNLQNVTLTITYIGYALQEQTLKPGQNNLNIKLNPSTETSLNDVVVVGYGETKKVSLTGSVATVDLKKVEDIPALSITAALRGTVPGLSVSGGTARPGQGTTITIRNPVSYSKDGQGTNPLFVIDDVIRTQADFDLLDQNEIESVSILKDAEASIYGVQGANGVLIVRTKRGRPGAPRISLSSSVGASNATQLPKMLNGTQLATFINDYLQAQAGQTAGNYINPEGYLYTASTNSLATTRNTNWYTPDELAYIANPANNTDYMKQAFKTAYVLREAINISGGSDKVTYFIGGNYVNQNSNFKGVNSYKYGLRASVEAKPAKGLTVFLSLSDDYSYNRSYWYKLKSTTESLDNDATTLESVQPWQKYFINGNPVLLGTANNGGIDNVNFFLIQNSNNYTGGNTTVTNMLGKITYQIPGIKGLTATVTMNKNINNAWNKQYGTTFNYYQYSGTGNNNHIPGGTLLNIYPIDNGNTVRLTPSYASSYQLDAGITYNRTFGKHSINFISLYEQRETYNEGVAAAVSGVILGGYDNQNFTTGTQTSNQASNISQFGFLSYINRLNYDYANKYLFQAVLRVDGSSRFAEGHQYGYFPEGSLGWVASEEPFIKNKLPFVDLLKFRASFGLAGSDNTKNYQYQSSYKVGTGGSGGAVFNEGLRGNGIQTNNALPNVNVTWDHSFKTNYGVDMQFLKNRLSVSADYFWNHSYDLLTTLSGSVPVTIGTSPPTENYSIVNTFGYEISASWRDHLGKKFSYGFSPFFTWSDNKLIRYDLSSGLVGTVQDLTGKSSDAGVFGLQSAGIIRTQADADAIIAQRQAAAGGANNVKIYSQVIKPGMINYVDLNGDGVIDDNDRKYLTHKSSNHNSLGLNFNVGYGGLNLNVIAGMSWGGWATITGLKPAQNGSSNYAVTEGNRPVYWADHWTPTNVNAKYPNPYYASDYQVATDFWLVRATTLNITSANLSYTLPTNITSKVGIASARFYVVATNPVQFINPFPNHYRDFQTDVYSYPSLRTFSLGLNVGF
ncbi:SusC/RagA family TonB-linked outer membrane protein [Mucilaginibacter robiniae]|uniref:SusC/RagA family TonB-linked outer membrane protein n=1 Tax=Mucilaginibacter robiniae TaxID=2728022 RepID=A0A7L5E2A7_9SPHI|nr:SusC/RagA family TonB-linked outer membrane protein [Mucilaginibacter robiniae]QJD97285.1 SusC/RagA family TonB-linked outer membrane protein [Mucilaginibacter robiniae]